MLNKLVLVVMASLLSYLNSAADCNVHFMVAPMTQGENVPDDVNEMLMSRIETAITATGGVVASPDFDRFFVTGKITHLHKDVVAGPPIKHAVHSTLTLYVGDVITQKVYATTTIELHGEGTSESRAFVNAFQQLTGKNEKLNDFVKKSSQKVISYYDNEYTALIKQAKQAEALHNYEQALSCLVPVPECSKGYNETSKLMVFIYEKYMNYTGRKLLSQAKSAWSASPDAYGAEKAYSYLNQIDPDASCYGDAVALHNEIKKVVKENWHFENKEKYNNEVDLERRRINAAREVGVAYGNGQKESTTNLMWLK